MTPWLPSSPTPARTRRRSRASGLLQISSPRPFHPRPDYQIPLPSSFLSNHLINMYAKLDLHSPAVHLLSLDPSPSVVSFTALISGAAQNNRPLLALNLFPLLLRSSVRPNDFTLPSLLKAAACLRCPLAGLQLHAFSLKSDLISDVFVISAAIDMYHKTGLLSNARHLFDEMPDKNVVAWNAVTTNAIVEGVPEAALDAFICLRMTAENPDDVSFCAFLNACASVEYFWLGSQLHSFIIIFGFDANVSVGNTFVDFYGKCACVVEARRVFDSFNRQERRLMVLYDRGARTERGRRRGVPSIPCHKKGTIYPD